jgi:alpha-D-ribose 1-methylphosphonate 5-triphosphate synthase subunit PhnI
MYVAVKGGEKAIRNAHRLLAHKRRGDAAQPELSVAQIQAQMFLGVARVMCEGALHDAELAALAIKQAAGDMVEAIFLLRAYRATLARFCGSVPLDTGAMRIERRISATYKDIPGGQQLGATFDYTHRLLDFALLAEQGVAMPPEGAAAQTEGDLPAGPPEAPACPHIMALLAQEGLVGEEEEGATDAPVPDITRAPLAFPTSRAERLQILARGDEGFLLALGYSTQRGYGRNHPFAGEIRIGKVDVWLEVEELGFAVPAGEIEVSECEIVNQFAGHRDVPPQFTRGYGLVFGSAERKAMAMALVDRALQARAYGEETHAPAQQEEFVLAHCDSVEAAGFLSHLKLPHYVDFQSELGLVRQLRREHASSPAQAAADERQHA